MLAHKPRRVRGLCVVGVSAAIGKLPYCRGEDRRMTSARSDKSIMPGHAEGHP